MPVQSEYSSHVTLKTCFLGSSRPQCHKVVKKTLLLSRTKHAKNYLKKKWFCIQCVSLWHRWRWPLVKYDLLSGGRDLQKWVPIPPPHNLLVLDFINVIPHQWSNANSLRNSHKHSMTLDWGVLAVWIKSTKPKLWCFCLVKCELESRSWHLCP